jgi:hypothetical protein
MLHHAHFYMKGGNRTFAAVGAEVCKGGEAAVHEAHVNDSFL